MTNKQYGKQTALRLPTSPPPPHIFLIKICFSVLHCYVTNGRRVATEAKGDRDVFAAGVSAASSRNQIKTLDSCVMCNLSN